MISAFSTQPNLQIRLPAGDVYLTVHIRDTLYCVSAVNLSAITVQPDTANILDFIARVQGPRSALTTYPLVQLLSSGNQNTVGQLITSICQELNKMYNQLVTNAVSRKRSLEWACLHGYDGAGLEGLTATSIFVSPLGSSSLTGVTLLVSVKRPILLSDGKKGLAVAECISTPPVQSAIEYPGCCTRFPRHLHERSGGGQWQQYGTPGSGISTTHSSDRSVDSINTGKERRFIGQFMHLRVHV